MAVSRKPERTVRQPPSIALSSTGSDSTSFGVWNVRATPDSARSRTEWPVTSCPARTIRAFVHGVIARDKVQQRVVLPEPFGPIRP